MAERDRLRPRVGSQCPARDTECTGPPQLPVSSALPAADPSAHPRLASGRAGSQIPRWAAGSWAAFNVSARTKCGEDPTVRTGEVDRARATPYSHCTEAAASPPARQCAAPGPLNAAFYPALLQPHGPNLQPHVLHCIYSRCLSPFPNAQPRPPFSPNGCRSRPIGPAVSHPPPFSRVAPPSSSQCTSGARPCLPSCTVARLARPPGL